MARGDPGRWEHTHNRLISTALDLFEHQGYEQTTASQIAQAAGVTEMTFFRHFSAKHIVLIGDPYDPVIVDAVAAQPKDRHPLLRAIGGIRGAWDELPISDEETVRRRIRIVARTPSLWGEMRSGTAETEALVADQLVVDGTDPLVAKVVAAAVLGGITAALLEWSESDDISLSHFLTRSLDALEPDRG